MTSEELEYYRSIDRELANYIKEAFPGIRIAGGGQAGNSFQAYLPYENYGFRDSEYFYRGRLTFFHLTSLQGILSVLNSRAIRLYDLHSSNDPNEYKHAAEVIGVHPNRIENLKSRLFTFSFCPISELHSAHMWKRYGNAGAAVVFEVINDPLKWINFHMSEIKYELNSEVQKYKSKIKEFEKKRGVKADFDPSRLVAFHKEESFKDEKEVRILNYDSQFDIYKEYKLRKIDYRLSSQARKQNRLTNYIELPLWVDNDKLYNNNSHNPNLDRRQVLPEGFFVTNPQIKIVDILISGSTGLEINEFHPLRHSLEMLFPHNFGYDVDLTRNMFVPPTEK